ncbi:hypothetical protein DFH06DRAFT_1340268 [Mycena polygramma]|nr:hypothetical protein DFH06DRAFT_1340268 [Mycena polygramma]
MLAGLEADRARVSELQIQIVELEHALSQLRIEQSQAQERINSYKYPILTLPNEITSEIFMHFVPAYPDFPQLVGLLSPTLLTQICQSWRDIALTTPKLWSVISSFDKQHSPSGWELPIFELWLQRSRCCPLSIRLGTDTTWANSISLDAVVPHRARWKYLKVILRAGDFRILDGPMPLLRHLDLMLDSSLLPNISLHEMPALRTLILDASALQITSFPWTRLTSLTLSAAYPSECVPILVQTVNLVYCRLGVYPQRPRSAQPRRDIPLPSLDSLILTDLGHQTTDFLQNFVVPALRTLDVSTSFVAPNPLVSLAAFVSTSGCRLEELYLTGGPKLWRKSLGISLAPQAVLQRRESRRR